VAKINGLLQKGFRKMTDKLENLDLDQVSESVQTAATKAAKTVTGVATDAAKTVETAWTEAKESREKPGGVGDYRVSGNSVMDGGCYNRISCAGSCKVSSELVCRELKASGSFRACAGVDCNGPVRSSGVFQCAGDLLAGNLSNSGTMTVQGSLKSGDIVSSGSLHVAGSVKGADLRSTGGLTVEGDVEADSFTSTGSLTVGGMVNADTVNIRLSVMKGTVGSIGGAKVVVTRSASSGLLTSLLKPDSSALVCDSIEGDQIELTGVKAKVVRGADVVIHGGCEIGQVEYTGTCTIDPEAQVDACAKL
jgi:cytoskeletal protein CcmA (bactofilin family)